MIQLQTKRQAPAMIGAHAKQPAERKSGNPRGPKPNPHTDGMILTRGQCGRVAHCLREIGRLGFIQGDGFTVEMAKAGPYRELLGILRAPEPWTSQ